MRSKTISVSDESRAYDKGFHAAFSAVKAARARHVMIRPHRSITSLKLTHYLLAHALVLPVVLYGLLLWAKPLLFDFWRNCIIFWSKGLNLPFSLSALLNDSNQFGLVWSSKLEGGQMPGTTNLMLTTVVTVAVFALSFQMKKAMLPIKYLVRMLCMVQIISLIYFWLTPARPLHRIAQHSEELMAIGYVVMLVTPVILAVGYYILNQSLLSKLFYTAIILLFLVIMVPHQVLVQALIMENFSALFMPVLFICFGAVFDALVLIALYSWVASNAPVNATV